MHEMTYIYKYKHAVTSVVLTSAYNTWPVFFPKQLSFKYIKYLDLKY